MYIFNGYYHVELAPIILVPIWIVIPFIVHCMTKDFRTGNITFRELEELDYRQIQIARTLRRMNLARSTPRPSILKNTYYIRTHSYPSKADIFTLL